MPKSGRREIRVEQASSTNFKYKYVAPTEGVDFAIDSPSATYSDPRVTDDVKMLGYWVEVRTNPIYYFDLEQGLCLETLPRGERARWRAYRSTSNDWFFEDSVTGAVGWDLPCTRMQTADFPTSPWLQIGAPVCVHNLRKQARFNDQVGTIVDAMPGRCLVQMPNEHADSSACSSLVLAVAPENITCLPDGCLVELYDLSTMELNGKTGTVQALDGSATNFRYHVKLPDGSVKSVRQSNLKPRCRLWNLGGCLSSSQVLKWRDEHQCLFIDLDGQHRGYALHLPLGFDPKQWAGPSPMKKYPFLMFLHGSGGGSFFTHSKKSMQMLGMQTAAKNFIVVSPRCEWTWKSEPSKWIDDLAKHFRALEWVDHERMYLSGCSMGGMGAWEVGARNAEIFAAVVPVAGHHKKERAPWIAHRLRFVPIYAIHDALDDTCPISLEQTLWQLLESSGHKNFETNISRGVDHCKIFEQAYCSDDSLYTWLLQKTLSGNRAAS